MSLGVGYGARRIVAIWTEREGCVGSVRCGVCGTGGPLVACIRGGYRLARPWGRISFVDMAIQACDADSIASPIRVQSIIIGRLWRRR